MNIRVLIDMNLSPRWVAQLARHGYDAVHWSAIGDPAAADAEILAVARRGGYVVFTHDLDFATVLALTRADGPSVLQIRGHNIVPEHLGALVVAALNRYQAILMTGALVVVEEKKSRARVLPL